MTSRATPPWTSLAARRCVLETLRRADAVPQAAIEDLHIEPGLYRAVFDAQLAARRAGERTGAAAWSSGAVGFRFAPERGGGQLNWPPPTRARERGRDFETQDDGYLCGMHALNNVAGGVLLDPPALLSAIGTLRKDDDFEASRSITLYAQRDELFLAALREGVVLAPLSLTAIEDISSLRGDRSKFPRDKCFERLLRDTGGLLVLAPGDRGAGGHWVPLVPAPDGRWLIYSFDQVIVAEATIGGALRRYLDMRGGVSAAGARDALSILQLAGAEYVAMVPLHTTCNDDDAAAERDMPALQRASRVVARHWARSVLANARLVGGRDVEFATPIETPLALHHVCNALLAGRELGNSRFRRLVTEFTLDVTLNSAANALAGLLADAGTNRLLAADQIDQQELRIALQRLRSDLRSVDGAGLMLGSEQSGGIESAAWLRYAALMLAARTIERQLDANEVERAVRCARLVAVVAFRNLVADGDTAVRYKNLEPFWIGLRSTRRRATLLPPPAPAGPEFPRAQKVVGSMLQKEDFVDAQLFAISGDAAMALWLLHACSILGSATLAALDDPRNELLEYVRARSFAAASLRQAQDWRAAAGSTRAAAQRRAVAPEFSRRLKRQRRELCGPGATVAELIDGYRQQAAELSGDRARLARATREVGNAASLRVARVDRIVGRGIELANVIAAFKNEIAIAADADNVDDIARLAITALVQLGENDARLPRICDAARELTDAVGFSQRYSEYLDKVGTDAADELLVQLDAIVEADDEIKAQQLELLFVLRGAESVYGVVLNQPPSAFVPDVAQLRPLPTRQLVRIAALRTAAAPDDGFVIVGRKARRM